MSSSKLKIPFSWFGGKSRVAQVIWRGLGEVSNYIEPFAGSLAVLLANPCPAKIETVNDIDHLLSNFWRAISQDSQNVVKFADYPVSQVDLHARHKWLVENLNVDFKNKMENDPHFCDVKMAGWWVYGQCASIGNNWLQPKGLNALPLLSSAGGGIHGLTYDLPKDFNNLQSRLKRVRITCGDWKKIITPSTTFNNKGLGDKDITGIFLDPPYLPLNRDKVYNYETDVFTDVCSWAIENGDNPKLRIVVCGYEGDYIFPDTWQTFHWKSNGGLSNLGNDRGKKNSKKETIWFSPACLKI